MYFPEGNRWEPSWKLVSEGLPEPGFAVIGLCHVAIEDDIHIAPSPVELTVGIGSDGTEYIWLNKNDEEVVVSHWMEFPPPPAWDYKGFYDAIPVARGL